MTEYWFDAAPLGQRRRRRGVRQALSSVRIGGRLSLEECDVLEEFTHANGLAFEPWLEQGGRDRPSLVLAGSLEAVVSWRAEPHVEFGNHGLRYGLGDNLKPSRRGYVAVRHGLELPHVYLDSSSWGPPTPLNAASVVLDLGSGIFDAENRVGHSSALHDFQSAATRLEGLPARTTGFSARAEKGREAEAHALLTDVAVPLLSEIATSFDIEVRGDWLLAYGYYGDVSTLDPETWAWTFSVASRMLDLLHVWGADLGGDHRALPFYTPERIPRPAKLDGSLSKILPAWKQRPRA